MKGLMVTLLVFLGSGSSLAQQFSGNDFSADRTNRSGNQNSSLRTNQTRLQPLTQSFDRTSMRVAQSSSTGDSGFSPTSSQTIGGTSYKEGSTPRDTVPVTASDRNQNNGVYGGSASASQVRSNSTSRRSDSREQYSTSSQSNNQLRAWPLPVSPEWERTLKTEGYIYAPIKPQEQNSIGEVVMFQDSSQFGNRSATGSNVTSKQWEVYKNTAIIDVDDFSLQEIQKRTLTLRNLGIENLTGVALRYVGDDGNRIDVRRIGNIPGNSSQGQVNSGNDFGRNQTNLNRGTRPNERQFNSSNQRDVSLSDRDLRQNDRQDYGQNDRRNFDPLDRDTVNNGGWDVNDNQRIRQPRQTFQRDDRLVSQRDSRDRFADDDRDFSRSNDRSLSNDYFDSLNRRDIDERDRRDIDYVRDRINQNRGDDYSSRSDSRFSRLQNDTRFDDEQYLSSNRRSDFDRDGRSSDYDANFASQRRELQQRLLDAKRLEVKNAEDAAWLKHQRETMEQARLDRLYDDDLTPLPRRSTVSDSFASSPYGYGTDRIADRSTDPNYRGQRTDALSPARASNASADRVAQILAEKEADLDAKIGAIDHLMKLDSAGRNLDSKINSLKNGSQTPNNSSGRVHSLVSQTVPNTLGGDLAAPRHPRLASNTSDTQFDGLNGRAPLLDINGNGQRGQYPRSSSRYGEQSADGASDGRMLRLMWLLLLISLGANVYLAMLSRSFYTQYEELADELRETFSTSSSI